MKYRIRIHARNRKEVDLDRLANALIAIVDDLDEETLARLAASAKTLITAADETTGIAHGIRIVSI